MNSEKESVSNANIEKCTVVLLDVAGTTTSTTFVKETLFAFATEHVAAYLKDNWEKEPIKEAVKLLQEGDAELDIDAAVKTFKKLTEENSSNKGVKSLQGFIYKKGYEDGDLKAHVYPDVPKAFESWAKDRKIGIYSTGSVESQKLLFAHTSEGDLSAQIANYFDQSVGLKTEAASYTKIAEELKVKAEEILFINDNFDELKAAKEAGLLTVLVKRDAKAELPEGAAKDCTVISSFADLSFDSCNKRKSEDAEGTEAPPTKIAKTIEENKETTTAEAKPEVVEEKVEKQVAETKESSDAKPEVEAMEVDSTETEAITAVETKEVKTNADSAVSESAAPEKASVPEKMETEEVKEETVKETKTAEEPILEKTDNESTTAKQADTEKIEKTNEELTKTEEPVETETKTEKLEPKPDVELACSKDNNLDENVVNKTDQNVNSVEKEVPEKPKTNDEAASIEVAEEAMEVPKENVQNGDCVTDKVEVAQEAKETNKVEEKKVEPVAESTKEEKPVEESSKTEEVKEAVTETDKGVKDTTKEVEPMQETSSDIKEVTKEPVECEESAKAADKDSTEKEETKPSTVEQCPGKSTETKVEETEVDKKTEDCEKTAEAKPAEEKSTAEADTKEKLVEKDTKEKLVEKDTKEKLVEKDTKEKLVEKDTKEKVENDKEKVEKDQTDAQKVDETKKASEETAKVQENGGEIEKQNGNKCELSTKEEITNGEVNGQEKNMETDPEEETDIKIKKIETNVGSPAVSVEV